MSTIDEVYRKFGETSEVAQLIETELGTLLLLVQCGSEHLFDEPDPPRAQELLRDVNKSTLGQLLRRLKNERSINLDEELMQEALDFRNLLAHAFFRIHNNRRNSQEGRSIMFNDLQFMHDKLLMAYKALMLVSGIDLDQLVKEDVCLPTKHLPI